MLDPDAEIPRTRDGRHGFRSWPRHASRGLAVRYFGAVRRADFGLVCRSPVVLLLEVCSRFARAAGGFGV